MFRSFSTFLGKFARLPCIFLLSEEHPRFIRLSIRVYGSDRVLNFASRNFPTSRSFHGPFTYEFAPPNFFHEFSTIFFSSIRYISRYSEQRGAVFWRHAVSPLRGRGRTAQEGITWRLFVTETGLPLDGKNGLFAHRFPHQDGIVGCTCR